MDLENNRCVLATCNLNNWALDFDGNLDRITESIRQAKTQGARYRLGPELEICGYSCEDHFLELDTFTHSYQSLVRILDSDLTDDMLCDVGCPVLHNNVRYNCRVIMLNRKILLVRPKQTLADDGNYRECRFFSSWKHKNKLVEFTLPACLQETTGQTTVPFGYGVLKTAETLIASEICEELWTPDCPNVELALAGVEIFTNGSGSHHQLRKLDSRLALMKSATSKSGGVYLYSNHRGGDGGRLYFDGSSIICLNGEVLGQASQFSLVDVEVLCCTVDLSDVRSFRQGINSFQEHSSRSALTIEPLIVSPEDLVNYKLCYQGDLRRPLSRPISPRIHSPEEECGLGPACWMWDYLRRSGAAGFLLPLSGGADSASVCCISRIMCQLAVEAALEIDQTTGQVVGIKDETVYKQIQKLMSHEKSKQGVLSIEYLTSDATTIYTKHDPQNTKSMGNKLCDAVLHSIYMGTTNSSNVTMNRAQKLAAQVGAYHMGITIDTVVQALVALFSTTFGKSPRFVSHGGTMAEDLALQNIQARIRMVIAYLSAQLLPWVRGRTGFLLVLGSSNVDEALRGYMTKYDCSSADLNPIGGISKGDLKRMLHWASNTYDVPALKEIAEALPTAELRPIEKSSDVDDEKNKKEDYSQLDEEEMGMSYAELGVFGFLRKVQRCGPVSMFLKLLTEWPLLAPSLIAEKVKRFFFYYSVNRHKMTTLTPSYHAENYSPDDNRFDLRQFLYNTKWTRQFATIDDLVEKAESK